MAADNRPRPAVHGHRGARGRRPENTLAAVEYALRHGADGVEVDLCVTADDAVVVHHDLRLNPDTTRDARGRWVTGRVPIRRLKWAELRRLDVGRLKPGSASARRFAGQTAVDGARIPLLKQCAEVIRRHWSSGGDVVLNLECKRDPRRPELTPPPGEYAMRVVGELERLRLPGPVFLQSFDWALVASLQRETRRRGLHCQIGWTQGIPYGRDALQRVAAAAGALGESGVLSCDYRGLNEARLQHARDLGLAVYAWTVNAEADMARMTEWGVDAIVTDYPERCRALRGKRAGAAVKNAR